MTKRRIWTESESSILRRRYPNESAASIAADLGRSIQSVYSQARLLGLKKSDAYLSSTAAGRLDGKRGASCRFKKGHEPWNKGKSFTAGGRSAETRFKPGNLSGRAAQRLQPVGAERVTRDGIRQRKIREDGPLHRRWKSVHSILWEEHNGPIPPGHIVVFRDRNQENICIENLELISRAENARRNSIHRYPPELKQAIRAHGKLRRQIRKAHEESN